MLSLGLSVRIMALNLEAALKKKTNSWCAIWEVQAPPEAWAAISAPRSPLAVWFYSSHLISYPSDSLAPRLDQQEWWFHTWRLLGIPAQNQVKISPWSLVGRVRKPHFRGCSSSETGGLLLKKAYEAMTRGRSRNHAWYLQVVPGTLSVALRSCCPVRRFPSAQTSLVVTCSGHRVPSTPPSISVFILRGLFSWEKRVLWGILDWGGAVAILARYQFFLLFAIMIEISKKISRHVLSQHAVTKTGYTQPVLLFHPSGDLPG